MSNVLLILFPYFAFPPFAPLSNLLSLSLTPPPPLPPRPSSFLFSSVWSVYVVLFTFFLCLFGCLPSFCLSSFFFRRSRLSVFFRVSFLLFFYFASSAGILFFLNRVLFCFLFTPLLFLCEFVSQDLPLFFDFLKKSFFAYSS